MKSPEIVEEKEKHRFRLIITQLVAFLSCVLLAVFVWAFVGYSEAHAASGAGADAALEANLAEYCDTVC